MEERIFIERLINLIEHKASRGPVEEWTNHSFFLLSCDIEEKTGQRISESTLKRILGKKKTSKRFYNPQIQTKDILANFLDYPNWHAFKNDLTGSLRMEKPKERPAARNKPPFRPTILLYIAVPVVSMLLLLLFGRQKEQIEFKARSVAGEVPYTAIFDYSLSNIRDSVFVDFGNYEIFPLNAEKSMVTEFYRSAGVPDIRVYTKNKTLTRLRLHNQSNNWQCGTSPNDTINAYRPFEPEPEFQYGDSLYLSQAAAALAGVNISKPHWIEFRKTTDFEKSLDSITFTCQIKNSVETGGRRCYDAEIYLLGSKSNIRMRFIEPGCFSFVSLQFSEKKRNGRYEDLSSFAVDLTDWGTVGLNTSVGLAKVSFNGEEIYSESYSQPLGDLWGIIFRFYGSGMARNIEIR